MDTPCQGEIDSGLELAREVLADADNRLDGMVLLSRVALHLAERVAEDDARWERLELAVP